MRVPGRLNIHWTDDNTLQLDTDSGTQTRTFRFGGAAPPSGQTPSLQGYSVASWEFLGARGRGTGVPKGTGQLRVRTTQMSGGYLRRNGVPYSENASLDEYFDTFTEPNGDTWLVVTSIVTDPRYLTQPVHVHGSLQENPRPPGMGSHTLQGGRATLIAEGAMPRKLWKNDLA